MSKYDFDSIIDRRNTDCLKYDFAERRGKDKDILPLWVADMDFKTAPEITEVVQKRVEHGIFGYTEPLDSYFEALQGWMNKRHDWEIEPNWLIKTPGVVFALAMAVQAFTNEGDAVLIQKPVYYPFSEVVEDNNRKLIVNTLHLGDDGKYHIDFEDFERKIVDNKVKLFLLCNPHNPVGRVWTKAELLKIGEICLRHNVIVASDEIHQDFVYEGHKHLVFANLSEELSDITITCTSPSKTFNLAGFQVSNILISNAGIRRKFRGAVYAAGYSQLNTLGLVACEAAYRHGGAWYDELMEYLFSNIDFVRGYLAENIQQIRLIEPEGTYLLWLDFRALNLTEDELQDLVEKKAGLWLDSGSMFGKCGEGFERINVACPRETLKLALDRLKNAMS